MSSGIATIPLQTRPWETTEDPASGTWSESFVKRPESAWKTMCFYPVEKSLLTGTIEELLPVSTTLSATAVSDSWRLERGSYNTFRSVRDRIEEVFQGLALQENRFTRISKMIDSSIEKHDEYKELNKENLVGLFKGTIQSMSPEQLLSITDEEWSKRIEQVLLVEALSTLSKLTPQEEQTFENAVRRRKLFE